MLFPVLDGAGLDELFRASQAGGHTQAGLWTAGAENFGKKLGIAVGRLDKELGLMLGIGALFQLFEAFRAVGRFNGQIAVESKTLSVET